MHTKGKWEVHSKMTETESGLQIIPVYNFAPNTRPTGRCICAVSGHNLEAQDNAKLIAAAPETAKQRDALLGVIRNALISIKILSMPRLVSNVASNKEIIAIMADYFKAAIKLCE